MNLFKEIDELIELTDIPDRPYLLSEAEVFDVPMKNRTKVKRFNKNTNRMRTSRLTKMLSTDIKPENRTFKNLPKYADGKPKVTFINWLLITPEKRESTHSNPSIGKSEADSKVYGWSHRAVYGFKKGDVIKDKDYCGREYIKKEAPFTIKSDEEAREMAIAFAKSVS